MRTLIRPLCAAFGLLLGASLRAAPAAEAPGPKLGVQAYSYRHLSFVEMLDRLQANDIHFLQAYPAQKLGGGMEGIFGAMPEATRKIVLERLREKNITLMSYGVVRAKTEAQWRGLFAFARSMGMHDIACEPRPESWPETLPLLEKLSREYGVAASLHNHPNPRLSPATVKKALAPFGPQLGLCADTGHWIHSGFDPVASLAQVAGRIISVHIKDPKELAPKSPDVPIGTGAGNILGQIKELRRQGFTGCIYVEYETTSPRVDAEIARSIEFLRRSLQAGE